MIPLADVSNVRVTVVGDLMLDSYLNGDTSRVSPEAPVPVLKVTSQEHRLGGAANVAANARALGATVQVVGVVGLDESAEELRSMLHRLQVDHDLVEVPGVPTIVKQRSMSRGQQLLRADFEAEPVRYRADAAVRSRVLDLLGRSDVVVISDYQKGALMGCYDLIESARSAGCIVVVDPKGADFSRYRGASVVTPNLQEFEAVVGPVEDDDDLVTKARNLCSAAGLDALLVTRGPDGMTLVESSGAVTPVPSDARDVYDVTGAGDTVVAAIAVQLGAGVSVRDGAQFSSLCAGIAVETPGTTTVSLEDVWARLGSGAPALVEDGRSVAELGRRYREAGQKLVFTNGCFDILHAGHVRYLSFARSLGDVLVVGLNDDESVARLKGPTRPVQPLEARLEVLAGLSSVDHVVPFSDDTPLAVIQDLVPDVLVKGGDYRGQEIVGADFVVERGGRVVLADTVDGQSTSRIVDRIKQTDALG